MPGITNIISASGAASGQTLLEQLLAAYRSQQGRPLEALKQRQKQIQERQKLLNNLHTRLEELLFQAQTFSRPGAEERFMARKVQSSAPEIVTATAQSSALLGSVSIQVQRTARNDVLSSDRLLKTEPFGLSGTYRFDLTAGGNPFSVEVSLNGTEDTETALRKIATAINTTPNSSVAATVIADTATTARLTLTAKQTGTAAAIAFADNTGLLSRLGWTNSLFADPESRIVATNAAAGYQLARSSELNAQLAVNGLTVVRESNIITDLLPGMTLTLLRSQQPTDPPVTLTTVADTES
ncbi:MAG: hypothetical protein NZ949_06110, partial [Candidatus Kapabacteria bacterium]|nr:hypothetical protein [Candidatus Kapabacteria bacterium]MDW7997583.1 flagellar cap protein FliD N-terminal domain-containing protein [Bacteroidota bacterium]